jgi:hypothetical protein
LFLLFGIRVAIFLKFNRAGLRAISGRVSVPGNIIIAVTPSKRLYGLIARSDFGKSGHFAHFRRSPVKPAHGPAASSRGFRG